LITDYTISMASPEKMAADAEDIVRNGFQVIKVKLGSGAQEDIERICAIRAVIGEEMPIADRCEPRLVTGTGDPRAERLG
jgi:L-alanine-DL-glutamate epimerase-like enolase superfamily enzyme